MTASWDKTARIWDASTEKEIVTQLAAAVAELSEEDQAACRERGRALEFAAAVERAAEVCGKP